MDNVNQFKDKINCEKVITSQCDSSGPTATYLLDKEVMMVVTYQGQESRTNPTIVRFGFPVCEDVTLLVSNAMVMAETEYQVWSLIQFYSVDFSQSRISVIECFFNKCTIKVCVSCC